MESVDINNCYFDRVRGYVTEFRVDARWLLKENGTNRPLGNLRVVSHPDLRAGHLRAVFTYVISLKVKTKDEKLKTMMDNDLDETDLEVYSIDNTVETESQTLIAPHQEINKVFGINVFEK